MGGAAVRRGGWLATSGAIAAAALAGCRDEQYVEGAIAFAMTEETPPLIESDDASLFVVERRVALPVEAPSDDELAALTAAPAPPYARRPWATRGDYEVEVDWTLSNLVDEEVRVTLTLDGANEFHEYRPGVTVVDDEVVEDYAQLERLLVLGPLERRSGTFREEQLDEVAVDLATVANGAPNSNQVVYFESQSARDPRVTPFIPAVVPALVAIRLGLRSATPARLVLEATVRARDEQDKLVDIDEVPWAPPAPELFVPVAQDEP